MAKLGKKVKPHKIHPLLPLTQKERLATDGELYEGKLEMILLQPISPVAGKFLTEFSKQYWRSNDGSTRQIAFMDTPHLFNCFRMVYDKVAETKGWPKMRATGLNYNLRSEKDAAILAANLGSEIFLRGDLPDNYLGTFNIMLEFCMGRRKKLN